MLGRFGKFTLVERLAEGGMAEVFKATLEGPEGFERIVAIKRLHRALSEDMDLTQMLVDEARIAVQLNHPNIGNVFDLGCIENQYFIIMEYIDGTDMQAVLRKARERNIVLPVPGVLFAVTETLAALHYAHTKIGRNGDPLGIVHRDVSPQNIMVTWDGRVKLVDFGIAKARNRAQTTQHGIIKGKFYYMAPEQAHGHHVDARTDVFAAGMVMYESLVGRSPYDDVEEADLLRSVRMADFPPPRRFRPDLDPELSALVEIATQRNPEKRFSSAMEFQLALNDYRNRRTQAFAEREMAKLVANIAKSTGSGDNFQPLDRTGYTPSEESLLFAKPDDDVLARAAGGGAIGNGRNKNPFADNAPTEIYDRDHNGGLRRDLPPNPRQHQSQNQHGSGYPPNQQSQSQTFGDLPVHQSQRHAPPPPPADNPPFQSGLGRQAPPYGNQQNHPNAGPQPGRPPMRQRAQERTKPSMVDRVAKPKVVYAAIAFAALLVVVLGTMLVVSRSDKDAVESIDDSAVATAAGTEQPTDEDPLVASPKGGKTAIAFNSEPANAQLLVDDVERGTTPLSLDLESGKTYRIQFVKDGYEIARQDLQVSDAESDISVTLEEAKGVLKILSYPPDAVVFIDDEEQGTTPLTLTGLETDQAFTVLAKLGKDEMEKKVQWDSGGSPVQEVMFEFSNATARSSLDIDIKEKAKPQRKSSGKRRYKRSRTRTRSNKPKPAPAASTSSDDDDEGLNVFGSASSSKSSTSETTSKASDTSSKSSSDDDDDGLNVFGSSSSSKKKSQPKKTQQKKKQQKKAAPKKEQKKDDDEDLDIW